MAQVQACQMRSYNGTVEAYNGTVGRRAVDAQALRTSTAWCSGRTDNSSEGRLPKRLQRSLDSRRPQGGSGQCTAPSQSSTSTSSTWAASSGGNRGERAPS